MWTAGWCTLIAVCVCIPPRPSASGRRGATGDREVAPRRGLATCSVQQQHEQRGGPGAPRARHVVVAVSQKGAPAAAAVPGSRPAGRWSLRQRGDELIVGFVGTHLVGSLAAAPLSPSWSSPSPTSSSSTAASASASARLGVSVTSSEVALLVVCVGVTRPQGGRGAAAHEERRRAAERGGAGEQPAPPRQRRGVGGRRHHKRGGWQRGPEHEIRLAAGRRG